MTATLFDCEHCQESRQQLDALRSELAWMRKRLNLDGCDRGRSGSGPAGYTKRFGHQVYVCGKCWRTGDVFAVAGGTSMTVETPTRLAFTRGDRRVVVDAVNARPYGPHRQLIYAEAVRSTFDGETVEWPASGIAWRGEALRLAEAMLTHQAVTL